ncbi:MAG TPA: hypothetical protein VFX99_00285 [Microbacterium sp.]|nr:hypothetical protein [Microbacterium sp.]
MTGEFERNIRIPITATPDSIERAVGILAEAMEDTPHPATARAHAIL